MRYQKANEILPENLVELIQSILTGDMYIFPGSRKTEKIGESLPGQRKNSGDGIKRYLQNTDRGWG